MVRTMGGYTSKDNREVSEKILEQSKAPGDNTIRKDNTDVKQWQTTMDGNNNLELYLNDLYKLELEFKISKQETQVIKNGIESLVHSIVQDTTRSRSFKLFSSAWKNTTIYSNDESRVFYDAHESFDFDEKDTNYYKESSLLQTIESSQSQRTYLLKDTFVTEDEDIYYDAVDETQSRLDENEVQNSKLYNEKNDFVEFDQIKINRYLSDTRFSNTSKHSISSRQHVENYFENILKVGSIYEKSKNHFPDEFDFIVIVGCSNILRGLSFLRLFHNCLQTVLGRVKDEKYCIKIGRNNRIYFDRYVTARGPASTLQFIYSRQDSANIKIHVDISPAVRIENAKDHVKKENCVFKGWYEEIIRRNCCLAVYVQDPEQALHKGFARISVTEFEMYLMKNVISKKHLKIYRLLKYLINGKDNNESLKVTCEIITRTSCSDKHIKTTCSISSYVIKTFLFRHHYTCSRTDDTLAGCLLNMLDEIEKHVTSLTSGWLSSEKHTIHVRTLINQELDILRNDTFESNMKLGKAFRYMKEQLQKLHTSTDIYKYEDCTVTSWAELANNVLTKQLVQNSLERLERNCLICNTDNI